MADEGTEKQKAIITPKAMCSYPHLVDPQQDTDDDTGKPKGKPKWSMVSVFAAGTDLTKLYAAADAAGIAKWGKAEYEKLKKSSGFKTGFRDGGEKYGPGTTFINARTTFKPQVVSADGDPATITAERPKGTPKKMTDAEITAEIYPGCFVRASVVPFGFEKKGNRGISWSLNNVQKLGEGDRIDNKVNAEDEFDVDMTATPADLESIS